MVHAGCGFAADIHLSMTRISGSFESMQWNACVHRLDLGLHSHPKEFLGNGVRTHYGPNGKIPYNGKFLPQSRMEATTLHQAGQRAPHTINMMTTTASSTTLLSALATQQTPHYSHLSWSPSKPPLQPPLLVT